MNTSVDAIFAAVEAAAPQDKVQVAEDMLARYKGDDKALIEPDILSSAIVDAGDEE